MNNQTPHNSQGRIDFQTINEAALCRLPELVENWIPGGRREGLEYIAASLAGGAGRSFSANLSSGLWADFASGERGGDAVSLLAAVRGIRQGEAARELARELGLETGRPRRSAQASRDGERRRVVASYDYVGPAGELVFQVTRWEPKNFTQRRPDGNGGWIPSVKGVELVPYRLPEVVAARFVFIVEGEKDADALAALGLTATCNAQGAGKFRAEYAPWFAGKRICVLPDADDPGRKHADDVARRLHGIAEAVKILELPGLPPKGDVSDWLAGGGTRAELVALAKAAPVWTPDAPPAPQDVADEPRSEVDTPHKSTLVEHGGQICRLKFLKDGSVQHAPLTSFVIRPEEAVAVPGEGEFIKAELVAGDTRHAVTFTPDVWASNQKFIRALPAKEFTFVGQSADVQHIRAMLAAVPMKHRQGTRTAGFHGDAFVTQDGSLTPTGPSDELVYINEIASPCRLLESAPASLEALDCIRGSLFGFNDQRVALPILGWTVACFFAPAIRATIGAFPLLVIEGEAGAGKSSTAEAVIARLWALDGPARAMGEQTRFSLMKCSDASNAPPLIFEEFKASRFSERQQNLVSNFVRDSYNAFQGQRGMADQSMRSYCFQAPVVIVGETGFAEPAVLDRVVPVHMTRQASAPFRAGFKSLAGLPLDQLGRSLLECALRTQPEDVAAGFNAALAAVSPALTDRPRSNAAVVRFGLAVLDHVLGTATVADAVDDAFLAGVSEDGSGSRKSAVDAVLEALGRMAAFRERGHAREYAFGDHIEENVHYAIEGPRLRLHVAGAFPVFLKWARIHGFDGDVIPEVTFRKQLQGEPYFVERGVYWIGGRARKSFVVDVNGMVAKGLEVPEEWTNVA